LTYLPRADLQPFLDRLLTRSILTDVEQQAILSLPTSHMFVRANHQFVREREETAFCCLIASGLVGRVGLTRNGKRQITALHIPGDMADLHSAVRPVGIGGLTAMTDTAILRVPHDAVRRIAAKHPAIAEAFWRDGMVDAAILMEWILNVGQRDAAARLAHIFCEMSLRYGRDREMLYDYEFAVTQEQLGDATGITGVHVNRSLKSLREQGLVTLKGGRVTITDWGKLARAGEFDPHYLTGDTTGERQRRLLVN
jgi:CRP-like cAMP-binding protein